MASYIVGPGHAGKAFALVMTGLTVTPAAAATSLIAVLRLPVMKRK